MNVHMMVILLVTTKARAVASTRVLLEKCILFDQWIVDLRYSRG